MGADKLGASKPHLRLAFLCAGDPLNVLTWSGTPRHMLDALRTQFDVSLIVRRPWPFWFLFVRRALRKLSGGAVDIYWSPFWSRLAAAPVIRQVRASDADVVFALAISPICAALVDNGRTVFVSDATQAAMVNYNPWHSALLPGLKRSAAEIESRCIQGAALSMFPSAWASESAVRDHGGSPDRVVHIPWGANLAQGELVPPSSRPTEEMRLLWIGTTWAGKGGDIVLDTIAEIRRRGHKVHIDMVGALPPAGRTPVEGVTFHGFLDKNSPQQQAELKRLFSTAHALFLPTRFDALGIVFAEAASYAVTAVSYRTGGVPSMVIDGETGVLLEEGSSADAFAEALIGLFNDRERYLRMCDAALALAQERFNWAAWAVEARTQIEAHWQDRRAPAA